MRGAAPERTGIEPGSFEGQRIRTVVLILPFGLISFPDIGSSSLKAVFARNGYRLDVRYCNLDFAKRIGVKNYQFLASNCNPYLVAEYPFATDLNRGLPDFRSFVRTILPPTYGRRPGTANGLHDGILREMDGVVSKVRGYLDDLEENLDLSSYDVIGFASSYAQNSAAWALAKRLRRRYPKATLVIGGANCEGAMGQAHVDAFDFIDFACTGEGELSFLELVKWLENPTDNRFPASGIVSHERRGGLEVQRLVDVSTLPVPDFDDYFREFERHDDWRKWYFGLTLESSRGCWWGEKNQCVFCGCNGLRLMFRQKPPRQFLDELNEVRSRYGEKGKYIQVVDNIMPHEYLDTFLPLVRSSRPYEALFYEIKSNLTPRQIEQLRAAGITFLQPGIESLSTPLLKLMRKGVTAIANIQTLKYATEQGIWLGWAILCGIPGEQPEHYAQMADLLPKIYHLNPPRGLLKISIDRHSPLHRNAGDYGLCLKPAEAYKYLYGLPDEIIERLAYWFEDKNNAGVWTDYYELPGYAKSCQRRIQIWQHGYLKRRNVRFDYEIDGDRLILVDSRSGVEKQAELSGLDRVIAESAMRIATWGQIRRAVLLSFPEENDESIRDSLNELVEASYIMREGEKYLFLGLSRSKLESRQSTGFWMEKVIKNEEYMFS